MGAPPERVQYSFFVFVFLRCVCFVDCLFLVSRRCFETSSITTHIKPIFKKYDVIHYCVPNIASRVARTATNAFGHIFTPILLNIAEVGSIEDMIFANRWFMKGVYTFKGNLTNADLGRGRQF